VKGGRLEGESWGRGDRCCERKKKKSDPLGRYVLGKTILDEIRECGVKGEG